MSNHLHFTPELNESLQLMNRYFEGREENIANVFSLDRLKWESRLLNNAEKSISSKLLFDLHFDMIVDEGAKAVSKYYQDLSGGVNLILERATKKLNKKINEQASSVDPAALFQKQFTAALTDYRAKNAQGQTQPQPTVANGSTSEIDAAIAGIDPKSTGEGIVNFLKKLWNQLTENGEAIGILHLILDAIGVIGDFIIPGLGAIADIINAIIYFCRGKWMLGTISLLAGLIFGAGDALKLLKGSAGAAEKVMVKTAERGTKEGADELAKVSVKEQSGVIKLLRFIAQNISKVLGIATSLLARFFDGFLAKITGWLPLIGKPLKSFFESIGSFFGRYAEKMTNFANGFSKVEKGALEVAAKEADDTLQAFFAEGGKMEVDATTGTVKCIDANGKIIGKEFPVELLTNPKILNKKYPNLFKAGEKEAIVKYNNAISRGNKEIGLSNSNWLVKKGLVAAGATGRLSFFIGKQVIKIITGEPWDKAGYKKEEVEYWGNSALQSWIQDELKKKREETGATYIPALDLDSSDKETFDRITNYQNNYAKLFGMPKIIPVVYDKYGNDEVEEDFKEFWDQVGTGEIKHNEDGTSTRVEKSNKKETNESASFKYIIPYTNFI